MVPKAAIIQTQTFIARGTKKQKKSVVTSIVGDSIAAGKREVWHGRALKIPPVGPSILQCRIIQVEYSLKVRDLAGTSVKGSALGCAPCLTRAVLIVGAGAEHFGAGDLCEASGSPVQLWLRSPWHAGGEGLCWSAHISLCFPPQEFPSGIPFWLA